MTSKVKSVSNLSVSANQTVQSTGIDTNSLLTKYSDEAFTYDDFLLVPRYSQTLPAQCSISTRLSRRLKLHSPIVSAAMDTVSEESMAISLAKAGAVAILHRNMSIDDAVQMVTKVKKASSGVVYDPLTIDSTAAITQLKLQTKKYSISGMPVLENGKVVGMVTNRDLRGAENDLDSVSSIMTPFEQLVYLPEVDLIQAEKLMTKHRIEKIPVLNADGSLEALITFRDIQAVTTSPDSSRDAKGRYLVGAAVGALNVGGDIEERSAQLVDAGVDFLVVDSAHGHSHNVLSAVEWLKQEYGDDLDVIAGNTASYEAVVDLIDRGVDAIKVGVGPGSICTTRIVAGVGVPQLTNVMIARKAVDDKGADVAVLADGGIRYSGDIVKALAAGADSVVLGSLLAGTSEAPGETVLYQGRQYKTYRGMGSLGAMSKRQGSAGRYMQSETAEVSKMVPEGIEGRVPFRGDTQMVLTQLTGGIRQGMGYVGAENLQQLKERARWIKISGHGLRESHVHDVTVTQEAPNYHNSDFV